ncbi:MAG TPA: 4Fe-4S dicluster domain-containing protein [Chitinivibrionales bacterium]|jgi:NAD-dependent dihydropyrimidine dehydrogenase PreA subunit
MIIHYGYEDGSGSYYVSIDAEKCDACAACIEQCPQKILAFDTVMIDLDDKRVAAVHETQRKKIGYTCASCHEGKDVRCVRVCEKGAIVTAWEKK